MRRKRLWILLRDSFWFLPIIYGLASILLVFMTNRIDVWLVGHYENQLPAILTTSGDVAKELYSALVTAILTMTTVSFSVIMAVLTTYSSQFSPRALQDFMRSGTTHHILGVYCLGFIFALLQLILVDKGSVVIAPIMMGLIAIIVLAFFVFFIYYSARWIQVNNLIATIRNDGSRVITRTSGQGQGYSEFENWDEEEITAIHNQPKQAAHAERSGYLQMLDWKMLVRWATENDSVINVHNQVGDFVLQDDPILQVSGAGEHANFDLLENYFIVGNERTDLQDIEFVLQKLVEIALRAISPSTNDPHTAINCIKRIGTLLSEIGNNYKENHYLSDSSGQLRIIKQPKYFADYLYTSFYQIRYYGKSDVSIFYSLIDTLYKIARVSNKENKQTIWHFHYYILEAINWDALSEWDYNYLQSALDNLKSVCVTARDH